VFNAGYGESTSILDLAKLILERSASGSRVEHAAERSGDIRHSRAGAVRLRAAGWNPLHGFVRGLEETMRFCQEQKP